MSTENVNWKADYTDCCVNVTKDQNDAQGTHSLETEPAMPWGHFEIRSLK
jgi:hypothetical protein